MPLSRRAAGVQSEHCVYNVQIVIYLSIVVTRQSFRVVDALAGSGFRHLGREHREPGRCRGGLFLETARERLVDVFEPERAYGRAHQTRGGRGEHAVEQGVVTRSLVDTLCRWHKGQNANETLFSRSGVFRIRCPGYTRFSSTLPP